MHPNKAIKKLFNELFAHEVTPKRIETYMTMAMAVGVDLGRQTTTRSKPVAKLDKKNGKVHTVYESMAAAARAHKVALANISAAIRYNRRSGGYYWKLVDPNDHYVYRKL